MDTRGLFPDEYGICVNWIRQTGLLDANTTSHQDQIFDCIYLNTRRRPDKIPSGSYEQLSTLDLVLLFPEPCGRRITG